MPKPSKHAYLAARLTPRDRKLISDLYDHNVMTTHQIHALHFPGVSDRFVRRRLTVLLNHQVVDRFRPLASKGSKPYHWILGPEGATVLAYQLERDPDKFFYRHDRALGVAHSPRLAHMLGVVDCLVAFTEAARRLPGAQPVEWMTEEEAHRTWWKVRPDGYVYWQQFDIHLPMFIEYDTGTESLRQVGRKLDGYRELASSRRFASVVLFVVHSPKRRESLARALAKHCSKRVGVYLTTHDELLDTGPDGEIWRPAWRDERVYLFTIAGRHPKREDAV